MNLAEICIKRPIFTLILNLTLVVLGIFSYRALGLDLFPKMDFPVVRIFVTLRGAGPEEIETQIAKPIEEAVNTLGGIDQMTTKCIFGAAQIVVRFDLEKDINVAAQEVRDRVARILKDFPEGTDPPTIEKIDPDASPVITLVVSSDLPLRELTYFSRKRLKEPLEAIIGVGAIQIVGGREREIHTVLDAKKLAAYGISVQQVKDAIRGQNIEVPGGNVTDGPSELVLRTLGRIEDPKKFADIIVITQGNIPIRIADIGSIEDTQEESRTLARLDGTNCVSLVIQKQSGVNTLDVIDRIMKRVDELKKNFPKEVKIATIRDQSIFVKHSLAVLNHHLIMGSVLASVVVLLFMGNVVSTFITSLAIPVSLIATFFLMRLMGFTLNNMSMLGLTLSVGIVIDDAIVVLENIFRHMEEKKADAMTAAREATAEIYLAVSATSLSLAVIFVPVAFMQGIIGRFLNNFGLTIAFSILVSLFVSFTLTPMLCSRFFQYKIARGSGHSKSSAFYSAIDGVYGFLLRFSMRNRWLVILLSVLCLLSIKPIGKHVPIDFIPPDDTNEYMVYFRADEGSSIDGTLTLTKEIEEKLKKLPGVYHLFSTIAEGTGTGVNEGAIFIQLIDIKEREFSMFQSMEDARKIMKGYPTLRPSVQSINSFASGKNADINYSIKGPDLKKIKQFADAIVATVKDDPGVGNIDTTFIDRKPEVHVNIDRERAYRLGVKLDTVSLALSTLVGGNDKINQYKEDDEMFEVRIRLRPQDRKNTSSIASLLFPNSSGSMVRLDSIASVTEGFGPAQIDRQDRERCVTILVNLSSTGAIGDLNALIEKTAKGLNMPSEYTAVFLGKSKEMGRTVKGFITAFLMSAIFMYMILAAQFESLLHPITIMLSLPLSIPFALISLWVTGNSLNLYSALGIFMLFGIVKKNAILQIDYTNTLREQGKPRDEAIYEANHARLRPILMTTITLVAGMLPMALGKGAGANTRASMAMVIIGGQSLCLLITLLLTPVAYSYFDDIVEWIKSKLPKLER